MIRYVLFLAIAFFPLLACQSSDSPNDLEYNEASSEKDDDKFEGDAAFYEANAQEYYGSGDYVRALVQFDKQLKLDPTSRPGRLGHSMSNYFIGIDLVQRGRLKDAEARFNESESVLKELWNGRIGEDTMIEDDFNWKSCLGLAMIERAIGALEKRYIDLIDMRITRNGDAGRRDELLSQQRKHDERRIFYTRNALEKFERLAAMKNPAPDALWNLGDIHLVLGNETSAERAYIEYLNVARRSVDVWNKRRLEAPDNYRSKNELKAMLDIIKKKQELATKKTVAVMERLAEIKFRKANYADCISYLKDALDLAPARYELNVPLAESYERLKNYDKALEHIDIYIKSTPSFTEDTQRAYRLRSRLVQEMGELETQGN